MSYKKLQELNLCAAWFSGVSEPHDAPKLFKEWDAAASDQYSAWELYFKPRLRKYGKFIPALARFIRQHFRG